MSKTKIDERIGNALDAFFETEPDVNRFELAYSGQSAVAISDEPTFTEKTDRWTGIARQVLLFGPGSFALFYLTLTVAFFYPSMGISPQGLIMFLSAVFMSYAGSGSIKNVRNLTVPLSTIATALIVVFASLLIFGRQDASLYFWHSIYLFPLVLITGKLVHYWVNDKTDRQPLRIGVSTLFTV